MKKRILLAFIFFLTVTFSFSQSMNTGKDLKAATLNAVEYLEKGVKMTPKQKEICTNAFMEYSSNIMKVQEKADLKMQKTADKNPNKKDFKKAAKMESRKYVNTHVMRFAQKRDETIKKALKSRQVSKYEKLVQKLDPMTMEVSKK